MGCWREKVLTDVCLLVSIWSTIDHSLIIIHSFLIFKEKYFLQATPLNKNIKPLLYVIIYVFDVNGMEISNIIIRNKYFETWDIYIYFNY